MMDYILALLSVLRQEDMQRRFRDIGNALCALREFDKIRADRRAILTGLLATGVVPMEKAIQRAHEGAELLEKYEKEHPLKYFRFWDAGPGKEAGTPFP